jgi:hypothetical protein
MTSRQLARRAAALGIVVALVLDIGILVVDGYAQTTRTHVEVSVVAEHEIIQVFVDCKLAYVYASAAAPRHYDLGWLGDGDILTFQVRGLKRPGYYRLSFQHGSQRVLVSSRGQPGHPVSVGAGQVAVAGSWMVDGRKLGEQGCQADAPQHLTFATPNAGRWQKSASLFGAAHSLARVIPWFLAVLGAIVVAGGALADRLREENARVGIVARSLFAAAGLAVGLLYTVATESVGVAFALCVGAGVGTLVIALFWLLRDDVRRLVCR